MKAQLNTLLTSNKENDFELSPKGKEEWLKAYFLKVELKPVSFKILLEKLENFYKGSQSEADFLLEFKDLILNKPSTFVSPSLFSKHLRSEAVLVKAFELNTLIGLDFYKCQLIMKRLYQLYPQKNWNYDYFMLLLNDYDPQLKMKLLLKEYQAA